MTAEERNLARVREAAGQARDSRAALEQAIIAAAKVTSLRKIGAAAGLTHARIHQIVKRTGGR